MTIKLEVCADNIESVDIAARVGVDRLELCSALALGGLSPSAGLIKYARENTSISLHAMIRPRAGDFTFSEKEIAYMEYEMEYFSELGIDGIVVGVLTEDFSVNLPQLEKLVKRAFKNKLTVTFHRAFDFIPDYENALEQLIKMGVNRILTSGHADNVLEGISNIKELYLRFGKRIEIMAGGGITQGNVIKIVKETGIKNIHCSASEKKNKYAMAFLSLGQGSSDLSYQVTDYSRLFAIKKNLSEMN